MHHDVRVHPIPFLVKLLQAVGGAVSREEYNLFVAKAKRLADVDAVAELIDRFRELSSDEQSEVVRQCDAYKIAGPRRGSIYNTIELNRSYAYKMWTLSSSIEEGSAQSLCLRSSSLRGSVRSFLDEYATNGAYITFANAKEFVAWMGDPELAPVRSVALDIYVNRGDLEAATQIKKDLGATQKELHSFKQMLVDEKTIEDNIQANFMQFFKGAGYSLELVGRQYPTLVGPIDLLGRDTRTGRYVVVELKKGRSADRVFGQLSRYMGWIKKNLADDEAVDGIIVSAKIDEKLRAARDAHPKTKVTLVEYQSKMSINVV